MIRSLVFFGLSLLLSACTHTVTADNSAAKGKKIVAGWIEKLIVEDQDFSVKAKLDTGAKTSSIYAENIETFKRDGARWVRFTLRLTDTNDQTHYLALEKPRVRRVKIKNHDGDHDSRAVVALDIAFNGVSYSAEFTLADRNEYIYGVLLGRDFLQGNVIVDADQTFVTQPDTP